MKNGSRSLLVVVAAAAFAACDPSSSNCPGGECAPVECPAGQHLVNGACVPNQQPPPVEEPSPCDPNPCTGAGRTICVQREKLAICECEPGLTPEGNEICVTPAPVCPGAHSGDALEPDDCFALARPVGAGVEAELHTLGDRTQDADTFRIDAAAGQIWRIDAVADASLQVGIDVFAEDGKTLVGASRGEPPFSLSFRADSAGAYFARIASQSPVATGAYHVTIGQAEPDVHPDSLETTVPAVLGATVGGRIDFRGDVDALRLWLPDHRLVRVRARFADAPSSSISIEAVDTAGKLLWKTTGAEGSILWSAASRAIILRISEPHGTRTGAWLLEAADLGSDDHADSSALATRIEVGSRTVAGRLNRTGDVDVFAFASTPGHLHRARCIRFDGQMCEVRIADGSGAIRAYAGPSADAAAVVSLTEEARFYIQVSADKSQEIGEYFVAIDDLGADDHGNSSLTATPTSAHDGRHTSLFEAPGDRDWFSFEAVGSGMWTFTCKSTPACAVQIRDASGAVVASGAGIAAVAVRAAQPTRYYVDLQNGATLQGAISYEWQLSALLDDHGDTASTASPLAPDSTSGTITIPGDVDVFALTPTVGATYELGCTRTSLGACSLTVRDVNGVVIGHASAPVRVPVQFKATARVPYFVEIESGVASQTGGYQIDVRIVATDDHGDLPGTATRIELKSEVAGTLENASDVDVFAWTAEGGESYVVSADGVLAEVAVVDAAGTVLAMGVGQVSYRARATEELFAEVRAAGPQVGSYKLTVF